MAVKLPVLTGFVENVTVNEVAVALVTVPIAPLLNTTVLLANTVLKPKPLMTIREAVLDRFAVLAVTTGVTLATCTAAPLEAPLVVTIAVKLPKVVGRVVRLTVNEVDVALVTTPTAPLLKVTTFSAAVELNPEPVMVTVVAFAPTLVVV